MGVFNHEHEADRNSPCTECARRGSERAPTGREADFLLAIRAESRKRVEKALNGLYRTFGKMDREALGALLDGAQDATMNWLPPTK